MSHKSVTVVTVEKLIGIKRQNTKSLKLNYAIIECNLIHKNTTILASELKSHK
jgi:hypothetical protein